MEDLWEILAKNPAKQIEPSPIRSRYSFDSMGYALPRLDDNDAMEALRLVTSQTPVVAKVRPVGKEPVDSKTTAVPSINDPLPSVITPGAAIVIVKDFGCVPMYAFQ